MQTNIWSLYNQTIAHMNASANAQYYSSMGEINAIQASSADPSDMVAYNMTVAGMNTIHGIQSGVIGSMSQLKDLSASAMQGQPAASAMSVAPLSTTTVHGSNIADMVTSSIGGMLPVNDALFSLLFIVLGIAIATLFYYRKEILS